MCPRSSTTCRLGEKKEKKAWIIKCVFLRGTARLLRSRAGANLAEAPGRWKVTWPLLHCCPQVCERQMCWQKAWRILLPRWSGHASPSECSNCNSGGLNSTRFTDNRNILWLRNHIDDQTEPFCHRLLKHAEVGTVNHPLVTSQRDKQPLYLFASIFFFPK